MDTSSQSSRSLSTSSSESSSSPYADVENNASSADLLTYTKTPRPSGFPPSTPSSSTAKTIAIMSLIISALSLLCVAGLSCWVFGFNENSPFFSKLVKGGEEERSEVCVPCLQVSPDPLDNASGWSLWEELTVRSDDEENDTKICCAVTAAQYAALFKLILQRQQEVQKLAEYLEGSNDTEEVGNGFPVAQQMVDPKTPVSAHLVFKPWPYRSPVSEDKSVQHWKSPAESRMSHVLPGLKLHHSTRLLVQVPGLYYVYCQFLYNPGSSSPSLTQPSDVRGDPDVTSAYVRRYSLLQPSAASFLLKSRHTRQEVQEDRHSSYVGGVLRLYRGDALYVQVSRPELISHDDVASFFGLFRVGP